MPPGAAAAATGPVTLGKRTLSPKDDHDQGDATPGRKRQHAKDDSIRVRPPRLELTDEEDASALSHAGDVPPDHSHVRTLKRAETILVADFAEPDNSSSDAGADESSDEECALTQTVIQKMALERPSWLAITMGDVTDNEQGNTHGSAPNEYSRGYSQAGYSQQDESQEGNSQEDNLQTGYLQEDDPQMGYSQEGYPQVGYLPEDYWEVGYSQDDDYMCYSQLGSYTLLDPETTDAAPEGNGSMHTHSKVTQAHSEPTQVYSEVTPACSEVMPTWSKTMHAHSKTAHAHSKTVHSHSEATHAHSKAMPAHSKPTRTHSGAMRTRSKPTHARSRVLPSHPEGHQGTHSGSAGTASNDHHTTPAHSNNRRTSEPIGGWPDETNMRIPKSGKPKLMEQSQLLRNIITASFPHLHASIMVTHAFPDAVLIGSFVLRAFLTATSHNPHAAHVRRRIVHDHEYLAKMTILPRARISVFRAEVKERCVAAVTLLINVSDSPTVIANLIDKQLNDNYNYIFPRRSNSTQILSAAPARSLPYRSNIITSDLFPSHQGFDGTISYEIPKSMLALVSTAYYAALYEWSNGRRQQHDFTANRNTDVYKSHMDSLDRIEVEHKSSYHKMMTDIYQLAASSIGQTAVPVPTLDISTLEFE
ncbi:hypothetical protein H4582DRAFT_2084268 [Lactarius indigo]|nr:hypothetical protein H4582DRAFT_2084268 [Lactarius indigo]